MKKLILFLLAIIPLLLQAQQKFSNADKAQINDSINALVKSFMEKSMLTEPGTSKQSRKVVHEYENLFTKKAKVFDDINPRKDTVEALMPGVFPYHLVDTNVTDYILDLAQEFNKGIRVINKRVNISYAGFDQGFVTVALERYVEATSYQGYQYQNDDTLKITISIFPVKTVKISNISKIGDSPNGKFAVLNDQDWDLVIDTADHCPTEKGLRYFNPYYEKYENYKGCPDKDRDGIPDVDDECEDIAGPLKNKGCPPDYFPYRFTITVIAGGQDNIFPSVSSPVSNWSKSGSNSDSYSLNPNSTKGNVSGPGSTASPVIGASIAYYLGKKVEKRTLGISLGFTLTHFFNVPFQLNGVSYSYNNVPFDGSNNEYERTVTVANAVEKVNFNLLNVPVMLNYKKKFKTNWRWAFELSAGPSYITTIPVASSINYSYTNASFEGTSQGNSSGQFNSTGTPNLVLKGSQINSDMFNANANTLFNMLPKGYGYDFADSTNKSSGTSSVNPNPLHGFAGNINAALFYNVSATLAFKASFSFVTAWLQPSASSISNEAMLNNSNGTGYNPFYNSIPLIRYASVGLNIGIIKGL